MSLTETINDILDGSNSTTGEPHDDFTLEEFKAALATVPKFENVWQALAKQYGFDLDAGDFLAIGTPLMRELERQFPELLPLPVHPQVKLSQYCKGIYLYRLPNYVRDAMCYQPMVPT